VCLHVCLPFCPLPPMSLEVVLSVLKVRSWFGEGATKNHPRFYSAFELT
jgi:hypothetical protein